MSVHYSSQKDTWGTPQDLFDDLNREFHFDVDVCATPEDRKVEAYFSSEYDGLKQDWSDLTCWMNPPYGRKISAWISKAFTERENGATTVALLPSRTDTKWWHEYIWDKEKHRSREGVQVRFLQGRKKFVGAKWNCPFPNVVVIFQGFQGKVEKEETGAISPCIYSTPQVQSSPKGETKC